jgi:uncharacterized protein (TIGR02266 family)
MTYSGAAAAAQSRQLLGVVLENLQRDPNVPQDVLSVAENIAHAVGALFEAERASSDVDGKASVRHAMGSLSQTMALLQDLRSRHEGIDPATRTLAEVMSKLYPLAQAPTGRPSRPGGAPAARVTPPIPPAAPIPPAPPVPREAAYKATAAPLTKQEAPAKREAAASPPPAAAAVAKAPPAAPPVVAAPVAPPPPAAPAPVERMSHPGEREQLEANVGATTESNFFVGFSGEIAEGGVFVATYQSLPLDTRVDVLVTLPGGFAKSIPGTVRFVRDPMDMDSEPGIGVRFDRLDDEGRELILRFIRKRPPLFYDD